MKKKALVGILAVLFTLVMGMGTVMADFVITDIDEQAEEMAYTGAWVNIKTSSTTSSTQLEFDYKGIDKDTLRITTFKGDSINNIVVGFGKVGMDKSTMAVSGSAITYAGDYQIFSDTTVYATGDNQVRARLYMAGMENLPAGIYTATLPSGCITVRDSNESKQLYTNKEFHIELEILEEIPEIAAPDIKLENNLLSWEPVEGAVCYKVVYYEDGIEPKNGHVTLDKDLKGQDYMLDIRSNFPYQPGSRYTVEVTACPFYGSETGAVTSEYVLYEKMSSKRVATPNADDFQWQFSESSKDNTILVNISTETPENIHYFCRLYAMAKDESTYNCIMYYRGGYSKNFKLDVSNYLSRYNSISYYMQICAVDYSRPDLACSEWIETEKVTLGAADSILSNIAGAELSKEAVAEITDKLLEKSTKEELSEALMNGNKDESRTGYETLEKAARAAKNVTVNDTAGVSDEVKDFIDASSIKTAGLAINAVSGSSVTLAVKKPEKEISIPAGYNTAGAVQVDIDVPEIETLTYPVMITMKIPSSLNRNKTIVIFHGDEKIYPVINEDGTMTFSVTHFSVFAFVNEKQTSNRPSGGGSSSSSSSSSSSNTVIPSKTASDSIQTSEKPGKWAKDDNGWWFSFTDKSYPASRWLKVNEKWYYFNATGYMATGWQKVDGRWYYLDPVNGDMAEGWKLLNGKWYYLNPVSGDMAEGWKLVNGKWYYLVPSSGECLMNTTTPDGYKVDENGAWIQ